MERLTNEQAKQEAIKKAYGDSWDLVKEFCDEEGWVTNKWVSHGVSVGIPYENAGFNGEQIIIKQYNSSDSSWRLRTIYSILTNNGWARIEPDGSNLPIQKGYERFKVIVKGKILKKECFISEGKFYYLSPYDKCEVKEPTHYKKIEKELLPIY